MTRQSIARVLLWIAGLLLLQGLTLAFTTSQLTPARAFFYRSLLQRLPRRSTCFVCWSSSSSSSSNTTITTASAVYSASPAASSSQRRRQSTSTSSSKNNSSVVSSITRSPYQILYPHSFSVWDTTVTGQDRILGLASALRVMTTAIQRLMDLDVHDPLWHELVGMPTPCFTSTTSKRYSVLRIQHAVADGTVDPLAWLHAQEQQIQQQQQARFYLEVEHTTHQVACLGAALEVSQTAQVFEHVLPVLPAESVVYGGERFDTATATTTQSTDFSTAILPAMTTEWQAFGEAYWMLPTVELKRQQQQQQQQPVVKNDATTTTLAVHLVIHHDHDVNQKESSSTAAATTAVAALAWKQAAFQTLQLLQQLSSQCSAKVPPTTLPPVLSRDSTYYDPSTKSGCRSDGTHGPELYEQAVKKALELLENEDRNENTAMTSSSSSIGSSSNRTAGNSTTMTDHQHDNDKDVSQPLQKVVLARLQKMQLGAPLHALDVLRRWKYGGHEGGHLFYLQPSNTQTAFLGCTPERLFSLEGQVLQSEALAGTRPRGSTQQADEDLLQELFASRKDQNENKLTGDFIQQAFSELQNEGWIVVPKDSSCGENDVEDSSLGLTGSDGTTRFPSSSSPLLKGKYFVRRLLHLQHICQRYSAQLTQPEQAMNVTKFLLSKMHPTPAVCGLPQGKARDFIRQYEANGFDRGFYAGPIGYIGQQNADIFVAIRSGLVIPSSEDETKATVAVYAGSGLVPGSTFQGEWAETNYKFEVISSLFPPSPFTLQSAPNANVAWAAAFVEELIRNGVTKFYVCPGSRSTPFVVAIARAARAHVGVVQAVSVHDERAAAFRAVGYGRGASRPAAVITSSGTAVANLYPAVVEAGMDGIPLLILTADRPYESRDTGANQAIDQVKIFSDSYVRWFRDILPPSDDVPVSAALSDAAHAVSVANQLRGPVHVNVQFRENLAPDSGPVRGDDRESSITKYSGPRFTDSAGFLRWSRGGHQWTRAYDLQDSIPSAEAVQDVSRLIENSKRGIIVVGNLRRSTSLNRNEDHASLSQTISDFAQNIAFPIFAGAQSGSLRFASSAVVPFAEHLLKCSVVAKNLKPDLIIQIGAPLISTEIPGVITSSLKENLSASHVLIHPHSGKERSNPGYTVTHSVRSEIAPLLEAVSRELESRGNLERCQSELAPLIFLGRRLQPEMKSIIRSASEDDQVLTEPEIALVVSEVLSKQEDDIALFLSNSMPVRDAEFFLYPFRHIPRLKAGPIATGTNRGASGIDGIISSALGFSEAMDMHTTLLIGDLSALHDLNSMHGLTHDLQSHAHGGTSKKRNALTTVVVNNDGGGIFSFLPISKYGSNVAFEEFFGTPTNSFSFEQGIGAFGVPFHRASDYSSFYNLYNKSLQEKSDTFIEAVVANRGENVAIHRRITESVNAAVIALLRPHARIEKLQMKTYSQSSGKKTFTKTMILLHGWMGDKTEWDSVGPALVDRLGKEWGVHSVDLPGHGSSIHRESFELESVRFALNLDGDDATDLSVAGKASAVLRSLMKDHNIKKIDAIVGYSLGGRVALEMKQQCKSSISEDTRHLLDDESALVLLGSYPGNLLGMDESSEGSHEIEARTEKDDKLQTRIKAISNKASTASSSSLADSRIIFDSFLNDWYGGPIWGSLQTKREAYADMVLRRSSWLKSQGRHLASSISQCSPPRNKNDNWKFCSPERTLFLAGTEDSKYSALGKLWSKKAGVNFEQLEGCGHALIVEAPTEVASKIAAFLQHESLVSPPTPIVPLNDQEDRIGVVLSGKDEKFSTGVSSPSGNQRILNQGDAVVIESLDIESFAIDLVDRNKKTQGVIGIGWGQNAVALESTSTSKRRGFIIEINSEGGREVGLGEVSPMAGLHAEDLEAARTQLVHLKKWLSHLNTDPMYFNSYEILRLDGKLDEFLKELAWASGLQKFLPSVRSGIEMALLSVASQRTSAPLHQALLTHNHRPETRSGVASSLLPVNGLLTRSNSAVPWSRGEASLAPQCFPSLKVKVGYQTLEEDTSAILKAFQMMALYNRRSGGKLRADANRAWNESQAMEFAASLDGLDVHAMDRMEFVEEPLIKTLNEKDGSFSFEQQVEKLERWYRHTGVPYALDESIADLVEKHSGQFDEIQTVLLSVFGKSKRGCAAFVLKPALLGLELSMRIARFARSVLGIGAVFSSSFDSGIGLAHTALLAFLSDQITVAPLYPHGIGTYLMLSADTLAPPFGSYVNEGGFLNIPSLSRSLFGLSLDELRVSMDGFPLDADNKYNGTTLPTVAVVDAEYEATTATSTSGKEISVVVSFPLPFSADIASAKFTDLPQQSRWSPWIASVSYQGTAETEWSLNVRGIPLKWRATSQILTDPWPGIEWQSVSGLKNRGKVEFIPDDPPTKCNMNVRMTIVPPRLLRPLFQDTSVFLEDFLREKLLKWSLEMFRDVVKADLALERGDVELGDSLFEAVEGKASAIEATLESMPPEGRQNGERSAFE